MFWYSFCSSLHFFKNQLDWRYNLLSILLWNLHIFSLGNNRELWIAVNRRSRFAKANFHTSLPTKEFFIVDASDSQVWYFTTNLKKDILYSGLNWTLSFIDYGLRPTRRVKDPSLHITIKRNWFRIVFGKYHLLQSRNIDLLPQVNKKLQVFFN